MYFESEGFFWKTKKQSIDPIPVPALVLDCIGIGIDITWYRYRINTIICEIAKR